jgi:hypothetical protein
MLKNLIQIGDGWRDAETGEKVDPAEIAKECVDLIGIVQRLNACATGAVMPNGERVFMTTDQLTAATLLLNRAWPAPKTLEVTGHVKHVMVPPDITAEEAEREYGRIVNGEPVLN